MRQKNENDCNWVNYETVNNFVHLKRIMED